MLERAQQADESWPLSGGLDDATLKMGRREGGFFEVLEYSELVEIARASLPHDKPFIILGESFSGPIAITLLKAAAVPFLYLQGSEDSVVPKSAADTFARVATQSRVEIVEGPHLLLQCVPEKVAHKIVNFVAVL